MHTRSSLCRGGRVLRLIGAAMVAAVPMIQAETAYEALQTVGNKLGDESLERIVLVKGNQDAWTVSLLDPNSAAQIQEVRVRKGRIVSKSTEPSAGRMMTPIDLDYLNLDSDGALKLARRHLQKTIPASRVDYTLSTEANGSVPAWTVKVRNSAAKEATFLQIAANDGSLIADQPSSAPAAAETKETKPKAPPVVVVNDAPDASGPHAPIAANIEPQGEGPADVVVEETGGVAPADPSVKPGADRGVATERFRERKARGKGRSHGAPDIVHKVAGKVERKVRFVRRIIPF